jgi:hypothetical protein
LRVSNGNLAHRFYDRVNGLIDDAALVVLAGVKRDGFGAFTYADERKPEIGLPRIPLRVETDQRMADAPSQPRSKCRIGERCPNHIARDCEGFAAEGELDVAGKYP